MAGGSFMRSGDDVGDITSQANALYAQMNNMRQAARPVSSGMFNDALASQASGVAGGLQSIFMPIGTSLNMTARQLERLTSTLQRSPLMTGVSAPGGQIGPLHMLGAIAGANIAMPGISAQAAQSVMPMIAQQNMALAFSNVARTSAMQTVPMMAGAAASLLPGGFFLGPAVATAGQVAMPGILRATGIDAALARPAMTRMIQQAVGDQFGGKGVAGRFREGLSGAKAISGAAAEFIRSEQQAYGSGFFAMNAEEYQPLVAAVTQMQAPDELRKMATDGGKRLKSQMRALIDVSHDLNMTFSEVAEMGMAFGAGPDSINSMRRVVEQVNNVATGGGITSRRALALFATQMRQQAQMSGQDVDVITGGTLSLVRDISAGAVSGQYRRGQLEAFGGGTTQERAQNMARSIMEGGRALADTGLGRVLRANILAGGGGGDFMSMLSRAGAQAMRDPFGLALSEADPWTNARVTSGGVFAMINARSQFMGGGRAGAAAALRGLQGLGYSGTQAGALINYNNQLLDAAGQVKNTGGRSSADLVQMAAAYAAQTGQSANEVIGKLRDGTLNVEQLAAGRQVYGEGTLARGGFTEEDIAAEVARAGAQAVKTFDTKQSAATNKAAWTSIKSVFSGDLGWGGAFTGGAPKDFTDSLWSLGGEIGKSWGINDAHSAEREAAKKAAEDAVRERYAGSEMWRTKLTGDVREFFFSNAERLRNAGFASDTINQLREGNSAALLSMTSGQATSLGISSGMMSAIKGDFSQLAGQDMQTVLAVLNAQIRGRKDELGTEFGADILDGITEAEFTANRGELSRLQDRLGDQGRSALFASAVMPLNRVNEINAMLGINNKLGEVIQRGAMNTRPIQE